MRIRNLKSGHSLAGTFVFLSLVMLLWVGVLRQTTAYLRVEKACQTRQLRSVGPARALSWSLTLLETSLPPTNPYSCRMVLEGESSDTYVATFTETGDLTYTVDVRPATEEDASLPPAPETFGGGSP